MHGIYVIGSKIHQSCFVRSKLEEWSEASSTKISNKSIHAIHNHYKAITLTNMSQSACKFGYSEFRSKLPCRKRSPSRNKILLCVSTPPKRRINPFVLSSVESLSRGCLSHRGRAFYQLYSSYVITCLTTRHA